MDLDFIELIKTVILGIVEGLTEWLPISSTGHMILVDEFIQLNVSKSFMDMFLVVIQLGAIFAVVVLNFEKLNPFSSWKTKREKQATFQLWYKVIVACIPAAVIGLAFNKYMEEHFMTAPVVAFTLIFYGILFIVVENYNKTRIPQVTDLSQLSYKTDLIIGLFPCSGYQPQWFYYLRRYSLWYFPLCGYGIYLLFGNSCHVRCESSEAGEVWFPLYWC